MALSRPLRVNYIAKFDRFIKKVNDKTVKTVEEYMDILTTLEEMRDAITEGVNHYSNQELLNDPLQYWYTNARTHYENKLDQLEEAIVVLKGKIKDVSGPVPTGGVIASPQA